MCEKVRKDGLSGKISLDWLGGKKDSEIHRTDTKVSLPGADPGFAIEGGADPREGGCQNTILPKISQKKCMKLRTF